MIIVGLTGRAGSGKDHMARLLHRELGFVPLALADAMRADLYVREGYPLEELFYSELRSDPVRQRLQHYGTEEMKPIWGDDIWFNYWYAWAWMLMQRLGVYKFVIPDVRFGIESDLIRELRGLQIALTGRQRDMSVGMWTHASELYHGVFADHTVNNSIGREQEADEEVLNIVRVWLDLRGDSPCLQ